MRYYQFYFFLFLSFGLTAQGSNYCSQQVGAEGLMLGGTLTAGDRGGSAMLFYNPAALSQLDAANFSLSASAFRAESFVQKGALGAGTEMRSQRGNMYPSTTSALIGSDTSKPYRMGFLVFSRQFAYHDANDRLESNAPGLFALNSPSHYAAGYDFLDVVSETWAGFGGSYKLSNRFSVGLSAFVSYRMQRNRSYVFLRASDLGSQGDFVYSSQEQMLRLNDFRLHPRLGLHYKLGKNWSLGAKISLPSLGLYSFSRYQKEHISQYRLEGQEGQNLEIAARRFIKSPYRDPASFALGISKRFAKQWIALRAEYFMHINPYLFVSGGRVADLNGAEQAGLANDFLNLYNGANAVLNYSIAFEQELNNGLSLAFSLRSDYSYHAYHRESLDEKQNSLRSLNIDIYHFSTGLTWRKGQKILSIAMNYGFSLPWARRASEYRLSRADFDRSSPTLERGQELLPYQYHLGIFSLSYTYLFKR